MESATIVNLKAISYALYTVSVILLEDSLYTNMAYITKLTHTTKLTTYSISNKIYFSKL